MFPTFGMQANCHLDTNLGSLGSSKLHYKVRKGSLDVYMLWSLKDQQQ
jgi:hypothetical protein